MIIDKYEDHPECNNQNKLLPILSNQKMNAYLKEIAGVCEIEKDLTFHIARHTFATTVTLTNGVPIESVSKMLGHKSLRTTQHYAKILDKKVSDDMDILRKKLSNNDNNKVINNTNYNFYFPNVAHNEFRKDSSNQVICSTFILVCKFFQKNILNSYRMLSKIVEMLKQLQLQHVFSLIIITLLSIAYIYNHNETMALEKELVRINKELHLKQVTFERRQKAYDEKAKQQREKLERMIKEINLHK